MDEFVTPAFGGFGFDGGFGKPVKKDHYKSKDQPAQARGMDHKNLEIEEVKEVEKVNEPVGATAPHRMKSVQAEAISAYAFSAGIRTPHLRFPRELQSSVRKSLDNADFLRHEWNNSSSART